MMTLYFLLYTLLIKSVIFFKFYVYRPWLSRNRLSLQKLWSFPHCSHPGGHVPRPLRDILNYSIDFYEIWYILCLTIMESNAISKIMVIPPSTPPGGEIPHPLGDVLNYSTDFLENWYKSSLDIMESIAITEIMVVLPIPHPPGGRSPPPPPLWGIFLTIRPIFMKFGMYCLWLSWNQ